VELLTSRYASKIAGTLSCYDRIVTLPVLSNAQHLTAYFYQKGIRIFDYAKFAEPFREQLKTNAEALAKASGIEIEFIRKSGVRKEAIIDKKLKERGNHTGIVHIISVMEGCNTYKLPWHDKSTHKTFLK